MKICSKCQVEKPLADFSPNKNYRDGFTTWCKECHRSYNREHYQANREKKRSQHHAWYLANTDKVKASTRDRREANPEVFREYIRQYRARQLQAPVNDFTVEQWLEICAAHDWKCHYCGARCEEFLEVEHVVPLSKGGSHTASNIVPACMPCNRSKGAKDYDVFVRELKLNGSGEQVAA